MSTFAVDGHETLVSDQELPRGLLLVPEPEAYFASVAKWIGQSPRYYVPVLASPSDPLAGFGNIATTAWHDPLSYSAECAITAIRSYLDARSPDIQDQHLCLAPNDPWCLAGAALLCEGRTKKFLSLPTEAPTVEVILDLIKRQRPKSLTFVTPVLGTPAGEGAAARAYLRALIEAVRAAEEEHYNTSFGFITGINPAAITQFVAKAVLNRSIAERYAGRGVHVVDETASRGQMPDISSAIGRDPVSSRLVNFINLPDLTASRDAVSFAADPRDLLVVRAHGRSYCASKGLLCGARPINYDATQPTEGCISGFECLSSEFHRLDPRRLDTRILLLATCDPIDLTYDDWGNGHAAIGFLAAAGFPSAVIAADGLVVPLSGNGFELLASTLGCSTVGHWCQQLNGVVRGPNGPTSFILFGDPDLPLAQDLSSWVTQAKVAAIPEESGSFGTRNWQITLPFGQEAHICAHLHGETPAADDVLYVWSETAGCQVVSAVWDITPDTSKLWLEVYSENETEISIRAEQRRPMPPVWPQAAAVDSALINAPIFINSTLTSAWEAMSAAGQHLKKIGCASNMNNGRVRIEDPNDVAIAKAHALALFEATQAACLSKVAEEVEHVTNVYLPAVLWRVELNAVRREGRVCPQCNGPTLLVRDYCAGDSHWRSSFDCPNCCFILDDLPLNQPAILSKIICPDATFVNEPVSVAIHLTNPHADRAFAGALQVSLSLATHGLRAKEPVIRFELAQSATEIVNVQFVPSEKTAIPHDYAVRAVALAEGSWHWSARRMHIVKRGGS